MNRGHLRIAEHMKFDKKPRYLNSTRNFQLSFRNRAYRYNTLPSALTKIKKKHQFKKWIKLYLLKQTLPLKNFKYT